MLPLGKAFVAARLSRELVSAAVGATDPQDIAVILGKLIDGPVICDDQKMGGTYYVLMAAQSEPAWAHQAIAPLLVHGTYLGVPRLNRHGPPGSYWAVAPRCTGDLSTPQCVAGLVALGHERLAIGDEQ